MDHINRVVAGVSGSIPNLAAVRAAVDQARALGVPLAAGHAWTPSGGEIAYRRAPCPILLAVWKGAARDTMIAAFEQAFGGFPSDIVIEAVLRRAEPGRALVGAACRRTDLLVIGSGCRHLMPRCFGAGTTGYCLNHACCAVLTIPPPEMMNELHRHWWHRGGGSRAENGSTRTA